MADAIKGIRFTSVQTNIKIPKFDASKRSPSVFLTEAERYFSAHGHAEDQFLYLIKSILPADAKVWLDFHDTYIYDWESFKIAFIERYDNWEERNQRVTNLQNRKQKLTESFEFFIYDVIRISKECFPEESTSQAVRRAELGLYPRVRTLLGGNSYHDPTELFSACRLIVNNIRSQDTENNRMTNLPPLVNTKENSEDSKSKTDKQSFLSGLYTSTFKSLSRSRSPSCHVHVHVRHLYTPIHVRVPLTLSG
jgi:hypothetical protein